LVLSTLFVGRCVSGGGVGCGGGERCDGGGGGVVTSWVVIVEVGVGVDAGGDVLVGEPTLLRPAPRRQHCFLLFPTLPPRPAQREPRSLTIQKEYERSMTIGLMTDRIDYGFSNDKETPYTYSA
jgi:hypothetical protein